MVRYWLAGVLVLLAACSDRTSSTTIVFAVATAPSMLDPRLASDAASERVNALLYDRLVELDEHGNPQPKMANWEAVTDRRFRLHLQADRASFWDGRVPDADDVVATYLGILNPRLASPHAGGLSHIDAMRALDAETIEVELSHADPLFPARLTIGILPAATARQPHALTDPMGSGTFAFVQRRADDSLIVRRRSDGQEIAFEAVADPTMRTLKLLRGEANLLQNDLPPELLDYLAGRPDVALQARPGTTFAYLGFNLTDPVLAQREVRAAIAHAIDRAAIVRYLFAGRAEPGESVLRPEHWAGADGLQARIYDPERARRLLHEVGYEADRPLTLSYKTSTDPLRLRIAHVLQQQLAQVGITLQIASYDWGTFFGDIKAGRFQMYSLAWVGVNSPDILRYAFHSVSQPPAGANRGRYRSVVVDRLIETAEMLPSAQAAVLLREVQRQVHEDVVYVPLWYESNIAVSRGVAGYVPGYDGNYLALENVRRSDAR